MKNLVIEQKIWLKENNFIPEDYKIIGARETLELRNKWRLFFISGVNNKGILHKCSVCNKEGERSYDWHAFSYKEVGAKEVKGDFLRGKLSFINKELYLLWEECNTLGLIMKSNLIKNCKWTNTDIYIFDATFEWSFVVTHEGWFYFTER